MVGRAPWRCLDRYLIRGTDDRGALLFGRYHYTVTFLANALPPVDPQRGGFWSLTMYDQDYCTPAITPTADTSWARSTSETSAFPCAAV